MFSPFAPSYWFPTCCTVKLKHIDSVSLPPDPQKIKPASSQRTEFCRTSSTCITNVRASIVCQGLRSAEGYIKEEKSKFSWCNYFEVKDETSTSEFSAGKESSGKRGCLFLSKEGTLWQYVCHLSPLLKSIFDDVNQTLEGKCYEAQLRKLCCLKALEQPFYFCVLASE